MCFRQLTTFQLRNNLSCLYESTGRDVALLPPPPPPPHPPPLHRIHFPHPLYPASVVAFKSLLGFQVKVFISWIHIILTLPQRPIKGVIRKYFSYLHVNMLWVLIRSAYPRRGASNEFPQHMFSWEYKKNYQVFGWKTCLIESHAFSGIS